MRLNEVRSTDAWHARLTISTYYTRSMSIQVTHCSSLFISGRWIVEGRLRVAQTVIYLIIPATFNFFRKNIAVCTNRYCVIRSGSRYSTWQDAHSLQFPLCFHLQKNSANDFTSSISFRSLFNIKLIHFVCITFVHFDRLEFSYCGHVRIIFMFNYDSRNYASIMM